MTLTPMQVEDIEKAIRSRRCLLDLPVGYGKTVIATCVSLALEPDTTIILVPPILIAQWVAWLNSIHGIGSVVGYFGSPNKREALKVLGTRWVVTSYQVFLNDMERFSTELAGLEVTTEYGHST